MTEYGPHLGTIAPPGTTDQLPPPRLAGWWSRVVASVLDNLIIGAVSYLAFPVQEAVQPGGLSNLPSAVPLVHVPADGTWFEASWLIGTAVAISLMQAYLGSTPGKLVVGIAVVRQADGRPAGLWRTLGRALAHLIDSILMVGYLRPLWNSAHQTFADSIASTIVIATRRPLPYTLRHERWGLADEGWERDRVPAWRAGLTLLAVVACGLAVPLGGAVTSMTSDGVTVATCTLVAGPVNGDAPFTLVGGTVYPAAGTATESRLGIERRRVTGQDGVHVIWDWAGTAPADDVTLRLSLLPTGVGRPVEVAATMRAGQVVVAGPGVTPLTDGSTGVLLDPGVVAPAGDRWTWSLTTTVAGVTSPPCGPTP
ncbi:MAG TPA: RDD family protein [Propionicimonas sp.]